MTATKGSNRGLDLHDKVVVVTGAGRGLGAIIAYEMAMAGATVVAAARTHEASRAVSVRIEVAGGRAVPATCDVTDPASTQALAAQTLREFGRADVVVANAGVAGPIMPMATIPLEEWRSCMAVNLDGVFLTFQPFISSFVVQGHGALIAIGSATGKRPLADRTAYAASKMGLVGMIRSLALELGPHGIRCNVICPGAIRGDRIEQVVSAQAASEGISRQEALGRFTDGSALRRLVEPEEVAAACIYLASAGGASVTGEDLNVSAGLVMY